MFRQTGPRNPLHPSGEQVFDKEAARPWTAWIEGDPMGTMRILDRSGDTAVSWDIADAASLAHAEEQFADLAARRNLAFARAHGAPASETVQVRSFDPSAEEIIWVRPIQGG